MSSTSSRTWASPWPKQAVNETWPPGLALAEQLYRAVDAQGYGRKGTQALMLGDRQLSAAEWRIAENENTADYGSTADVETCRRRLVGRRLLES